MKDEPLKSAYELALERLKQRDRAEGLDEHKPLSDAQKRRIAELRQQALAKRAEIEILAEEKLEQAGADPEKRRAAHEHHETDLRRVDSWLESAIAEVKRGA